MHQAPLAGSELWMAAKPSRLLSPCWRRLTARENYARRVVGWLNGIQDAENAITTPFALASSPRAERARYGEASRVPVPLGS